MKAMLLGKLTGLLIGLLDDELLKRFADMVLDFAENTAARTETTVDDKIVLPLCQAIRRAFDIED